MRQPVALPVVVLMVLWPIGCGRAPSPPAGSGPSGGAAAPAAEDPVAIIKSAQEAAARGGVASAGGTNRGTVQVGSHRLRINMDVPASYVMDDERAALSLPGQTLTVDFGKGRVLLNNAERAKLPADTKVVDVEFVGGKLAVTADGTPVFTSSALK